MKQVVVGILVLLLISACASNPPAPVIERTAQAVKPKSGTSIGKPQPNKQPGKIASNNDWRPDYHVVKKGDTLISIGLEYGYYYKDIALANNINAPFIIKIGQQINLSSINSKINGGEAGNPAAVQVEDGVVLTPISSDPVLGNEIITPKDDAPVITKPITKDKPPADTKPAIAVPALSEPKAVREPYSLAAMNRVEPVLNQQNSKNNSKEVAGKPLEPKLNEAKPAANKAIDPKAIISKPTDAKPDVAIDAAKGVAKDVTAGEVSTEPNSTNTDVKPVDAQAVQWSWPTKGKVIASFNEATNKGLDIAGETGQAITAASAGKVIYSGSDLRGYGKLVIIKHNKTFLSVYAHNSKIIVKEGQIVASGQKIAEMGDTDSSTVKLHFEIRRLGKSVNPAPYFN